MGILVQNWVEKPSIWGGKRGDFGGRGAVFGWKKAFFGVEKGVFGGALWMAALMVFFWGEKATFPSIALGCGAAGAALVLLGCVALLLYCRRRRGGC